jgi:antitoxin MazE
MPTKLCKWGDSLGVRLPQYVVERTVMSSGDLLYIGLTDEGLIVIKRDSARDIPIGYLPNDSPASYVPGDSPPKVKSSVTVEEKW